MAPTAARGQLYGVAAAIGKVGAFAGIWGDFYLPEIYACLPNTSL